MGIRAGQQQAFMSNPVLPKSLQPGNVGDYADALWPTFFTFNSAPIPLGGSAQFSVTINQEAAFIWRYWMISIYEPGLDGAPILSPGASIPTTLTMSLRDAQSTRTYHDVPETLSGYDPNYPYFLTTPLYLPPNYALQATFNYIGGQAASYQPILTLLGYRVRIPRGVDANQIVTR